MKAADSGDALSSHEARAAFVAAMQAPGAYALPPGARAPIDLVETHVSWIFLTGTHAYKVKKPLRLSFLDYSTAARREHFCREELRLNRRHAPALYLDVVPIAGTPAVPRVGATDAPAFEHALRMVQFDRAQELDRLLERGDVVETEIAAFASEVARVHDEAATAAPETRFGTPEAVHRVTVDNLAELERCGAEAALRARLPGLRDAAAHRFARVGPRMEARRASGRVRECHGDLHCGNVVRWEGRLVAFDGLEFDPALRFIDVANDVAFLSIELLPYYETHRALVRAKVAALRAAQRPATARAVEGDARRYVAWAVRNAAPEPPRLLVMAGLSGSGKTWLGTRLARAADALLLRSDVERKRLAGLAPLARSGSAPGGGLYTREFNERTYARLCECVAACVRGGQSVVVDAANLRRAERAAFLRIGDDAGAETAIVRCVAPLATLRARIEARGARGADASEATVELLGRQPAYWEALTDDERTRVLTVDTGRPSEVEAALARFRRPVPAEMPDD